MRIAYICADPGVPVCGCKGASIHVQEVIRALVLAWLPGTPCGLRGCHSLTPCLRLLVSAPAPGCGRPLSQPSWRVTFPLNW